MAVPGVTGLVAWCSPRAAEASVSDTSGQRKSGPARRADIVGAARAVFLAEGYADVGLTDVAAAGEVSRGLVYRHFPRGRSELFLAVTEDLLGELQERAADDGEESQRHLGLVRPQIT